MKSAAERFGDIAWVAPGGSVRVDVLAGASGADGDGLLVGELFSAAVVQPASAAMSASAVPGQVLLAQPVQVDADGIGVLGGVRGGLLAVGVEAPPDWPQGHGQRVVAQDLAHVVGGDAQ